MLQNMALSLSLQTPAPVSVNFLMIMKRQSYCCFITWWCIHTIDQAVTGFILRNPVFIHSIDHMDFMVDTVANAAWFFFTSTYIPLAAVTIAVLHSCYCHVLSTAGSLNVALPSSSFSPNCYNCGKISARFMLVWLIYMGCPESFRTFIIARHCVDLAGCCTCYSLVMSLTNCVAKTALPYLA